MDYSTFEDQIIKAFKSLARYIDFECASARMRHHHSFTIDKFIDAEGDSQVHRSLWMAVVGQPEIYVYPGPDGGAENIAQIITTLENFDHAVHATKSEQWNQLMEQHKQQIEDSLPF